MARLFGGDPIAAVLESRPTASPALPNVAPYVPWSLPATRELPPTRVASIEVRNTGLNSALSTEAQAKLDVSEHPENNAEEEQEHLVIGPCTFEQKEWGHPCLNHADIDVVLAHAVAMFLNEKAYYVQCLHHWANKNDGQHRLALFAVLRKEIFSLLLSPHAAVRHFVSSLLYRLPEDTLLEFLKDISSHVWVQQFTHTNSIVLQAILQRVHLGAVSPNFAMHRVVIATAITGHVMEIISRPQSVRYFRTLWQMCMSKTERQPLLAPILANLKTIFANTEPRNLLRHLNVLNTEDREEINEIWHAFAAIIQDDDLIFAEIWSLFRLPLTKSRRLVADIAMHHLAPFIPSWLVTDRAGFLYILLEAAESETASEIVCNVLINSPALKDILNFSDNASAALKLVMPLVRPHLQAELKALLLAALPTLNAQSRFHLAELSQKPRTPKKRGRDAQTDNTMPVASTPKRAKIDSPATTVQ